MDLSSAREAFKRQKAGAKRRGIGWELTFEQWLEWWGDDLDKRGRGKDDLQMQRFADKGPYAIGNIKKGVPQQNTKTAGNVKRNRASERRKREHQAYLGALMWGASKEAKDEIDEEQIELMKDSGVLHGIALGPAFKIDKNI
ncbi:MAG: hypothetical protein KGH65_05225 [Candidatus Micrarchaeota archaeon]|nr:hypothetical protein [Candidatus Micrarchaeota archaeon]